MVDASNADGDSVSRMLQETAPVKAIEKAGGIDIPDFLEGTLENIIKEQLKEGEGKDPMEIVSKYLK